MIQSFDKEWYTTKEAQELTGEDSRRLTKKIREGKLTRFKKVESQYLIHVSVLEDLFKQKDLLENNYISYQDTARILNKSLKSVNDLVYRGTFVDVIKVGRVAYISKTEVEKYIDRQSDTISPQDVIEITGLSKFDVSNLISDGTLRAEQVNDYLWYVSKKSVDAFIKEIKNSHSIDDICEQFNIDSKDIDRYKKISWLKTYNVKGFGERVIQKDYINFSNMKKRYLTIQDIAKELGIKEGVVRNSLVYTGLVKSKKIQEKIYVVTREEIQRFSQTVKGVKIIYHGREEHKEYFNDFMDALETETEYKESLAIYRNWSRRKIGKAKVRNKKLYVSYLLNNAEKFFSLLNKEVWELTDTDIQNLINNENTAFSSKDNELLFDFLRHCKKMKDCSYSEDYSSSVINNRDSKEQEDRIYTKEEWVAICTQLSNVNLHMEKAIESSRYAEAWLFTLLHLSLAWRNFDYSKIPSPSLEIIGISGFEWFNTNEFSLELAQRVINDVRMKGKDIIASKNKVKATLVIGLTIPTALAFVVCEIHRRNSIVDNDRLLSSKLRSYDYKKVLGEELPAFKSLKCNRTLLTYQFETAVIHEGRAHIAYQLSSYSRAHKGYTDRPNDITSVYLVTTNTDVSADNISFHLFERGFFGWQIGMMLSVISDKENVNLKEKTSLIKQVNDEISPLMVETISEYVNTRHEEAEELLKELMLMPTEKIREKLDEISQLKSPAIIEHGQCIKGIKNCPYTMRKTCFGCKYLILTNYILEILNTHLFDLFKRLEDTPISNLNKRIKYTHMIHQLMFILMDFKRAYNNFDENYISSFIDLNALKEKFQHLEREKFLKIDNGGEVL
ncbi:helix-turn-helix domain-containing protein [Fredinandcohnia quinoae]|uniref:Helix-turn-helix domain-containing protein n=1 Tax=Fredinandcohnia quinoae TaxID=2918902 RepID=A0AAW5E7Y4_9BACI|nr:helix-turn-helix domain-containing protein [Fredinandcohnia sp. SECRCQ15]MCH1626127.1 helix-turn-helix domain-containing protein [Fredinandcohnia sp. SECRCQ15]